MRLNWNSYSEWPPVRRERSQVLIILVACALAATTSAAVILSLGDFPIMQTGVPQIATRALVRNACALEDLKTAENTLESRSRPIPMRAEPVPQMEEEQAWVVHSAQSKKDRQQRSRRSYWRERHGFRPLTRVSSRRDELTAGAR